MAAEKWRVIGIMLLAVLAVSLGEAMLARGVKQSSVVSGGIWSQIHGVLNVQVIVGTLLMMIYFGLYMLALRGADFSFVLPLSAVSYLIGAFLAKYYLHETVTPARWMGTLLIMAGVALVGLGEVHKP